MKRYLKYLVVLASINLAILSAAIVFLLYYELQMLGFPDGHISKEQPATKPRLQMLAVAAGISSLCFVMGIGWGNSPRGRLVASAGIVILVGVVAFMVQIGVLPPLF